MTFSRHNEYSSPTEGAGDWDTDRNSNDQIAERGLHTKLTTAEDIGSGEIIWTSSGALAHLYNAASLDLKEPHGMSYKLVNSGEEASFVTFGLVTTIGIWSGDITPGQPAYVSVLSPGIPVGSYSAAGYSIGIALDDQSIAVHPGRFSIHEKITSVSSLGELVVGSAHQYAIDIGHAGVVRRVEYISNSHDAWSGAFFSGSAGVTSESLLLISSINPESFSLQQDETWSYRNTDTASPGMMFGQVTPESGSGVGSGHVNIIVHAERFR